jgi:hypothetical protein
MTTEELKKLIQKIVAEASLLNKSHTYEQNAPVNYACIFAQGLEEYEKLINVSSQIGYIVHDTSTGPVFYTEQISTVAGPLCILKIRQPDSNRPEQGDADFTVSDYEKFKSTYIGKPGFNIIERPEMEMVELKDPSYNVLAYYSHPTLANVLKIKLS